MEVRRHETIHQTEEGIGYIPRRVTPFRAMVEAACRAALHEAARTLPLPVDLNAGVALLTDYGERFPELWLGITRRDQRLRPSHFEASIHNSAAGHVAIQLGLYGPQIVLVGGDIHVAAKLQLLAGRSRLMIVCTADISMAAECYILEVA